MEKWCSVIISLMCNLDFIRGNIINHVVGQKLLLDCNSLSRVDCIWKFQTRVFQFSNRHSYVFADGFNATDCSLEIKPFLETDAGNWSCWSLSDNFHDGRMLNFYKVAPDTSYYKKIIKPFPQNVTSMGDSVIIPCLFTERIGKCNWLRNGDPVVIRNRYRYTNNAEGHYSTDCSMEISNVKNIDLGVWQCSSASNGRIGYIVSEPAWLDASDPMPSPIHQTPIVQVHPVNQTGKMEDQIVINCKFDQPVYCAWLRNGQLLEIHYKFEYLEKTNGKSKDCSISISSINDLDYGSWQCLSAADDKTLAVKSVKAFLDDEDILDETKGRIIEGPKNQIIALGRHVHLKCKFDINVYCVWQRNDIVVRIDQRYQFTSKDNGVNTTDCSILIQAVAKNDFGRWTCGCLESQMSSYREATCILKQMKLPSYPKIRIGSKLLEEIELFSWDQRSLKSINCFSNNGFPAANLSWELNGLRISGQRLQNFDKYNHSYNTTIEWSESNGIESLKNATELHCVSEHPFFNKTIFASVRIRKTKMPSSPVIIQDGQEINITSGFASDNIICLSLNGHPAPKLYWEFDGLEITGITEYQGLGESNLFNTTLHWNSTLDNTLIMNDTTIHCVAEHADFQRPLKSALKIKPSAKPVLQLHGTSLTSFQMEWPSNSSALSCISECGKYESEVHWECDGEKVPTNFHLTTNDGTACILFWNTTLDQTTFKCNQSLVCVAVHAHNNITLKSTITITQENPVKETIVMSKALLAAIILPTSLCVILLGTLMVKFILNKYHGKVYFKYRIKAHNTELKEKVSECHAEEDGPISEGDYV